MNVVDMHCDTIAEIYSHCEGGALTGLRENSLHMDLLRMKQSQYLLQNFALFVHLGREKQPFHYVMKLVDRFYQEMDANQDLIGVVTSFADIEANQRAGRMSALLAVEEGGVCEGQLAHLRGLYRLGVRMMTLTWNFPNELGHPNHFEYLETKKGGVPRVVPETKRGLTETGIAFVTEMERLGMIIDVSHLGDAGIWDVFRHTKKPFVASHSNARALASHSRNLTDEMLVALSERGGVAGVNFCAAFLQDEKDGVEPACGYKADMVRHMKHMKAVGGIQCIGIGSDFDGIPGTVDFSDCSGIQQLADEMSRQGFTTGEIEQVFYKNVLRVYKEVL